MKRLSLLAACLCAAGPVLAEPISVLTEPYPPYNFEKDSEIRGAAADQVHIIFSKAQVDYRMQILPWARAYSMATSEELTCIYSTTHTDERDKLFKWVEPLSRRRACRPDPQSRHTPGSEEPGGRQGVHHWRTAR